MIAKVIWNMAKTVSGIVPLSVAGAMPERKLLSHPPYQAFSVPPSPKARL